MDTYEAQLNAACFHRSGEERQRRLARDVAMHQAELNAACLHRAWEERQRSKYRLMAISQKRGNTYEAS